MGVGVGVVVGVGVGACGCVGVWVCGCVCVLPTLVLHVASSYLYT